ncbi:hypothetical protein Lser_V15G21423 [Lactuca serriola]
MVRDCKSKVHSVWRGNMPMPLFECFTEKANQAVILAQEVARSLGHNYVGPEMILLGIIGEGTSIVAKVLLSMGVNYETLYVEVENIIDRVIGFVAEEIRFTPVQNVEL